jgi:hypothetical protein
MAEGPPILSIEQSEPHRARVSFAATFHGAPVVWDARIATLESVQRERGLASLRQFIHVLWVRDGRGEVHVGLPVAAIDRATVLKAVTMLRQWRRLDQGLHTFGPSRDYRRTGDPLGRG